MLKIKNIHYTFLVIVIYKNDVIWEDVKNNSMWFKIDNEQAYLVQSFTLKDFFENARKGI